jgi:hypothetical protein|tara:strand:+ start:682 stop:1065 length:384 start_codon:yes stop_codon:yes gene_type:complete
MSNSKKLYLQIVLGPVVATGFSLLAVLLVGLASWPLAKGVTGIAIGAGFSVLIAVLLHWKANWPTSIIASGFGATVACFFAIASAELFPPGSFEWMWKGGLYGAMFGIPIAIVFSPLALLGMQQTRD